MKQIYNLVEFLQKFAEIRDNKCFNKISGRQISACLPMHTFGFPVHIEELLEICKVWKIPLIEDAAESLGSTYKGKPTGGFGIMSVFSFNGNKIITSGGGGSILTNDKKLAKKAKFLTTTAKKPHPYEFIHTELGYNFRLPNINAALACAQLENLQLFLNKKRELAIEYEKFFTAKGIKFRRECENTKANYWLMAIEMDNKRDRDMFLKTTNRKGIMSRPIWRLLNRLPMYKDCYSDSQTNSKFLEERIVNIPSGVNL